MLSTTMYFFCAADHAVTRYALERARARALWGHRRRGGPGLQDGLFSLRIASRALSCFNLAWIIDVGARATCAREQQQPDRPTRARRDHLADTVDTVPRLSAAMQWS